MLALGSLSSIVAVPTPTEVISNGSAVDNPDNLNSESLCLSRKTLSGKVSLPRTLGENVISSPGFTPPISVPETVITEVDA